MESVDDVRRRRLHVEWELDYDDTCELFDGPEALPTWQALGDVLAGRTSWAFRVGQTASGGRPLWTFGRSGAGHLVADATPGRLHVFDHQADSDHTFDTAADLTSWLEKRERHVVGYSPMEVELREYLSEGQSAAPPPSDLSGQWVLTHCSQETHLLLWHEPGPGPALDNGGTYCQLDGGPPYVPVEGLGRIFPRCPLCAAAVGEQRPPRRALSDDQQQGVRPARGRPREP